MSDTILLKATYDPGSDVLYVMKRRETAVRGVEDAQGIVWRYGRAGDIISATVLDFREQWENRQSSLAHELSLKFDVPDIQAESALRSVTDSEDAR